MAVAEDAGDLPDWTAGIAERKIQDAIEEGLFDNLPGRGQPLDLSVNPFEPPGMRAVNRILKQNRVLPPWLLLEQEIEASRGSGPGDAGALGGVRAEPAGHAGVSDVCGRRRGRPIAKHLKETNDLILKYNLSNPFAFRAPIPLLMKRRLREFDERLRRRRGGRDELGLAGARRRGPVGIYLSGPRGGPLPGCPKAEVRR